jgi:hypothetical protein
MKEKVIPESDREKKIFSFSHDLDRVFFLFRNKKTQPDLL